MLTNSLRSYLLAALAAMILALVAASAVSAQPFSKGLALARIVNAEGQTIGAAALTQKQNKKNEGEVRIYAWARGLAPGKHGIHVHAIGSCSDPAFASAGSHFNPTLHKHGLRNPEGPHNGDLPNLTVRENRLGILRATTDRISLSNGPKSLFDADGSAIIIHASEDDQLTDPTGNSGARIACGVIQRAR